MKNLICPVSTEKIHENLPRVTAFIVTGILLSYILTGFLPIVLFLMYDFFVRGYNYSKYSLIYRIAKPVSEHFQNSGTFIDKAPKLFAARLGGIMSVFITVFHLTHVEIIASALAVLVGVLAALECFFNFCVGCYIYSWFVLPFARQSK